MGFEIHAQILALHYEARFLRSPGSVQRALRAFDGIVQRFSAPTAATAPSSPSKRRAATAQR
jgi:hypothetical protein